MSERVRSRESARERERERQERQRSDRQDCAYLVIPSLNCVV